jgi:hypothetical protein
MNDKKKEYKSAVDVISIALVSYTGSFFFGYQLGVTNLSFGSLKYAYGIESDP